MTLTTDFDELRETLKTLALGYHEDQLKLTAVKDAVILTTDDRESRWALQLEAEVEELGEVVVPFRRFMSHFVAFTGGEITINEGPTSVALVRDTSTGEVPKLDAVFFPEPPSMADAGVAKKTRCEMVSLRTAIQACSPAIGVDTGFAYTEGVYLTTNEAGGFAFATDRKQLVRLRFRGAGEPARFTLDQRQLRRVVSMEGLSVDIEAYDRRTRLKNENFIAVLANFQVDPPDVSQQFVDEAKKIDTMVQIPACVMLEALKLANSVGGERSNFWPYLDLGTRECRLRAEGDRDDEINVDLKCQAPAPLKIYINHKGLLRSLTAFFNLKLCETHFDLLYTGPRGNLIIPFSDDRESLYLVTPVVPIGREPKQEAPKDVQLHEAVV